MPELKKSLTNLKIVDFKKLKNKNIFQNFWFDIKLFLKKRILVEWFLCQIFFLSRKENEKFKNKNKKKI